MREGHDWTRLSGPAIAVEGRDRLILDDISRFGLHRRHVIRLGELPSVSWLGKTPEGAQVDHWFFVDETGIGHLWFCWKETAEMRIVEFVNLVCKMRSAQKTYFKTRTQSDLIASKQLEASVDRALTEGVTLLETRTLDNPENQRPTVEDETEPK